MEFLIFYQKWITLLYRGWKLIFISLFKDFKVILKGFQTSFWLFIILSIILITIVSLPWFSYTIHFSGEEEVFIRTKKWYIFIIPGIVSFILIWYYTDFSFKIHIGINIAMILLYIYGFIVQEYHIQLKGTYKTLISYYLYMIVLFFHTFYTTALKQKENFIFTQVIFLWKEKIKQNI